MTPQGPPGGCVPLDAGIQPRWRLAHSTPHFLFRLVEKKTGRTRKGYAASVRRRSRRRLRDCTVQKKRPLLVATLHVCAKLLYGGRRIGACFDFALPSGTLGSSARLILPSRGGWFGGRRGARAHLTSFSFRAFRFATRSPGNREERSVGLCWNSHQPPASGSENRRSRYP